MRKKGLFKVMVFVLVSCCCDKKEPEKSNSRGNGLFQLMVQGYSALWQEGRSIRILKQLVSHGSHSQKAECDE